MSTSEKNTLFVVVILIALLGVLLSCCCGALGGFVTGASQARWLVKRNARLERLTPWPPRALPDDWTEIPPSRGPRDGPTPEVEMPLLPGPAAPALDEMVPEEFWDQGYDAGAFLLEVTPASPAQSARLRSGDIILALDESPLTPERTLADAIATYKPGDEVQVAYWRRGIERSTTVTLAEHPDNAGQAYLGVLFVPIPVPEDTGRSD